VRNSTDGTDIFNKGQNSTLFMQRVCLFAMNEKIEDNRAMGLEDYYASLKSKW